ncbi:MAG: mechanosensitive ion channel family protein, partial [Paracoccus sp. (in: a-proteobacteria)]
MDQVSPDMINAAQGFWARIVLFFEIMLVPTRLYQLVAVAALLIVSWLLARVASRFFTDWLRHQANWPKWRLRLGLLIDRRMTLIVFMILAWAVALVMREITWPSRSQLIALAATIATAWVAIFFLARVIRNRFLRRIVSWAAWIWVTLYLLDLIQPAANFLDTLAITIGDLRLSALVVLKALAVTGLMIAGARILSRLITGRLSRNEDISPTMRVLTAKLLQVVLFSLAVIVGLKAV